MQEEVENRTLTLIVSGTKFTGRLFKAAISKYMAHRREKKLEKQQRDQEQAAKAAAAKEYAARKGIVEEAAREETAPLSGVSDRPFCKGRNYDPDRYAPKSMEE